MGTVKQIAALGFAFLLFASANAVAQSATTSLFINNLAPGPASQAIGSSHRIPFQVQLTAADFACEQEATLEVTVAATAAAGLRANVTPSPLSFSVPAGLYGLVPMNPLQPEYNESMDVTLQVDVLDTATPGLTTITVKADYAGGQPAECAGTTFPAATDQKGHTVSVSASDGRVGGTGNQSNNNESLPPSDPARTPGFEAVALLGAMAAAVLLARRRR